MPRSDDWLSGRAAIEDEFIRRRKLYGDDAPQHVITNIFLDPGDGAVAVRSLVLSYTTNPTSTPRVIRPVSVFHDTFVYEENAWLIQERWVQTPGYD